MKRGRSVLAVVVIAGVIIQSLWLQVRRPVNEAAITADRTEAARDTTRVVLVTAPSDGDSLRLWERRAIQAEQRADALDRALGRERAALAELRVAVPVVDTAVSVAAGGARVIREAPVTVELTRRSPAPTDSVVGVRVSVDTIALSVRIGCGAPRGGVRPATVVVSAPAWATVSLGRVEQEPRVCNPERPDHGAGGGRLRDAIRRIGVSMGYGAMVMGDGTIRLRPSLIVGLRVWP